MTTTPLPPPALWHDQTISQWKVLTKPYRPTYVAYYTAEQVHQARADLEAENQRLREALRKIKNWPVRDGSVLDGPKEIASASLDKQP